jgi:SAM-dependent methyltransferase
MNMTPYFQQDGVTLYHGDCREILQGLPDESVSAIVTDPPYGLAFMGKKWDYDVPAVEVWAECLRALKPGGHLLAFAGTRTQHRMAVRIEDAGFEIRDMIAWVYGSGFPKSLDVSKAIDRMDATEEQERRRLRFTAWVRGTGATSRQIDEATGTNMGGHYTTAASQPAIMTREHLEQCRHLLGDVPEWVEREADIRTVESRNMAEREVVGKNQWTNSAAHFVPGENHAERVNLNITAPATPEAQQWQGWGTALKPALEPITVARKPLIGTVAENVLAHGTGGINVDGCRIATVDNLNGGGYSGGTPKTMFSGLGRLQPDEFVQPQGRWPANLIHDGSEEVVGLFPETASGTLSAGHKRGSGVTSYDGGGGVVSRDYGNDSGSAARFFYTAKADKSDRGPGNNHPTVKPVDLMRYLVRLVCPIGGVVLDPFSGSGTTLAAAQAEGCLAIGVEREAAYCEIIKGRFHQRRLF